MRLAKIFFLLGASAAFSLGAGHSARAGGGGPDFIGIENFIASICSMLNISSSFCPTVPTVSQGILELAALHDSTPEAVRSEFAIPVAPYVDAANPSRPPAKAQATCAKPPCVDPLNPFTLPIDPSVLSTLRPLAFVSAATTSGTATPTQLYDPDANIFFYAVGGRSSTSTVTSTEPDTLLLFYEDLKRDNKTFKPGQTVASFSLPLMVLNSDFSERAVSAVLQLKSSSNKAPDCSASTVTGNFLGTVDPKGNPILSTVNPTEIGVGCAVAFGATPMSSHPHAVFEVSVPLLITIETDYIVVNNHYGFYPGMAGQSAGDPFAADLYGFQPTSCPGPSCILGNDPLPSIGIAPSAGPLGPAVTASSPPATYSLCANLPTKGPFAPPLPAVAAFYAIAGNGADVLVSAPLAPTPPGIVCPAM
jgi:hypothetical protein